MDRMVPPTVLALLAAGLCAARLVPGDGILLSNTCRQALHGLAACCGQPEGKFVAKVMPRLNGSTCREVRSTLCWDLCVQLCTACGHQHDQHLPGAIILAVNQLCSGPQPVPKGQKQALISKRTRRCRHHSLPNPLRPLSNHLESRPRGQRLNGQRGRRGGRRKVRGGWCLNLLTEVLHMPVAAVGPPDDTGRLFVVEKNGVVWALGPQGWLQKDPFLDLRKVVQTGSRAGDERGMLSLAFHPDFARNGKLYVSYTTRGDAWGSGPHDHILRVSEFTVSRKSWRHVSRNSERRILDVAELRRAHLGGELLFGPDGLLYVVLGDGRITLDDMEEMDGLSDFTGSILRINVSVPGCDPPYAIPPDNPHANGTSHPPEAYTHGLRSPGRCSVTSAAWHGTTLIVCFESAPRGNASARLLHIQRDKDFGKAPSGFE